VTLLWVLLAGIALVALIIAEGKRQERKYGKPEGRSLIGTGMLEIQRHLEPQRKVEMLIEKRESTAQDDSGDSPDP
jgi:hypothetical protein